MKQLYILIVLQLAFDGSSTTNILLEFTTEFMHNYMEEHYASVVYVSPSNGSDSFKHAHAEIITKSSRANTFMTYVRHVLHAQELEPCKKHVRLVGPLAYLSNVYNMNILYLLFIIN